MTADPADPMTALLLAACLLVPTGSDPLLAPPPVHGAVDEAPPVFTDLGWEAAKAAARDGKRLLLLDAMTSWCGPCKIMDATTWVDPEVVAWLGEHAVAVQLDMDEHVALKEELGLRAYPTMVLFRPDGTEFDRIVGLRKPGAMLQWLEGARGGSTEKQRLIERVEALEASGEARVGERITLASMCASTGAAAEGARLARWLWTRTAADGDEARTLGRWRRGAGRNLSLDLAGGDPSFTSFLRAQRGERAAALAEAEATVLRSEWIVLNEIVGDDARTLAWAAEAASTEAGVKVLRAHSDRVFDPLVDAGLWATAGAALVDPLRQVRFLGENLGAYDVAPAAAKRGPMPAIPMGAMTPAAKVNQSGASTRPKVIPAIPLGGMTPARPSKADENPAAARDVRQEKTGEAKVIPAIPLGGMTPARPAGQAEPKGATSDEPKAIPAIPMGGMKPAQPAVRPAIPMVPMGKAPGSEAGAAAATKLSKEQQVAREVRARLTHELRRIASRRYGALLAAGRDAEAEAVAMALLGYASGPEARAQLVAAAIRAGRFEQRREVHLRWLDEAARVR